MGEINIKPIASLIKDYIDAEKDLLFRQKCIRDGSNDFHDLLIIDLQIRTNKKFINDLLEVTTKLIDENKT